VYNFNVMTIEEMKVHLRKFYIFVEEMTDEQIESRYRYIIDVGIEAPKINFEKFDTDFRNGENVTDRDFLDGIDDNIPCVGAI